MKKELCVKLVIYKDCTKMHGQQNMIKKVKHSKKVEPLDTVDWHPWKSETSSDLPFPTKYFPAPFFLPTKYTHKYSAMQPISTVEITGYLLPMLACSQLRSKADLHKSRGRGEDGI